MNSVIKFGLAIAISGLAACGQQDQAVSNVAAANDVDQPLADGSLTTGNDAGAMHAAPPAPDPNVAAPAKVAPAEPAKTAPKTSAPAKPAPSEPAKAEPITTEQKATDPACPPEHRAAGHC